MYFALSPPASSQSLPLTSLHQSSPFHQCSPLLHPAQTFSPLASTRTTHQCASAPPAHPVLPTTFQSHFEIAPSLLSACATLREKPKRCIPCSPTLLRTQSSHEIRLAWEAEKR